MALLNDANRVPVLAIVMTGLSGMPPRSGIDLLGLEGLQARKAHVVALQDTFAVRPRPCISRALPRHGRGPPQELDSHRASLALRQMVLEMNEVPTDAISTRARSPA
jgi:hypothetical protein